MSDTGTRQLREYPNLTIADDVVGPATLGHSQRLSFRSACIWREESALLYNSTGYYQQWQIPPLRFAHRRNDKISRRIKNFSD